MKTEEIIRLLNEREITQTMIADELRIRLPTVNSVVHKRTTSRHVQNLICKKLDMTFNEVWG